jgi:hypothetical protein
MTTERKKREPKSALGILNAHIGMLRRKQDKIHDAMKEKMNALELEIARTEDAIRELEK